jgi:hypothetical protein
MKPDSTASNLGSAMSIIVEGGVVDHHVRVW